MIDPSSWVEHSLSIATPTTDAELEQRLGLYRVFLKLYDHHRDLLDEILELENAGCSYPHQMPLQYVQAVVQESQTYLVTNLVGGQTQALMQPQNAWLIGRDRTAALHLPDERLSRCHAVLQYVAGEGFYLFDLNSTNGSFINGERVRQVAPLKEGDRIRLGSLTFSFFISQASQEVSLLSAQVLEQLDQIRSGQTTTTTNSIASDPLDWQSDEYTSASSLAANETSNFSPTPMSRSNLYQGDSRAYLEAPQSLQKLETVLHSNLLLGECN